MTVTTSLYVKNDELLEELAPSTIAKQVEVNDSNGAKSNVEAEIIDLRKKIASAVNAGIHFKGVLTNNSGLPTTGYKAGWQYSVQVAGTYAGVVCEVGDLIVCIKDYSESASNSDWSVLQANIVGAVTGPASSVANHVAIFDGVSGKVIKDGSFTIGKSVPSNAVFTDTTYVPATDSADGLLTASLHKKLIGIASGAEVNQAAFSKVKVGSTTLSSTDKTDTLELSASDGITMTASGKKVEIKESYIDSCVVSSLDEVPSNLRSGGLVVLKG